MAVLMVTGNAAVIPHSLLTPVRTIPATIAAELGEAPFGGLHYKALFATQVPGSNTLPEYKIRHDDYSLFEFHAFFQRFLRHKTHDHPR